MSSSKNATTSASAQAEPKVNTNVNTEPPYTSLAQNNVIVKSEDDHKAGDVDPINNIALCETRFKR